MRNLSSAIITSAYDNVEFLACTEAHAQVTNTGFVDMLHLQCQQPGRPSQDDDALGIAAARTTQRWRPSTSSDTSPSSDSPCNCLCLDQQLLDRLDQAARKPEMCGLDQILVLMQNVSRQLSEYRECPRCSSKGIQHLINMAMLQQSQVALLCTVARSPSTMFWPPDPDHKDAATPIPRFTLGVYQLTPEDDLEHKMLAMLTMLRQVESRVACFDDLVRTQQTVALADSETLSDFADINLQWLFNVASNLKKRLRASMATLQRLEWTPLAGKLPKGIIGLEPRSLDPPGSIFDVPLHDWQNG